MHGDRSLTGTDAALAWAELRPRAVIADTDRCTAESVDLLRRHGVRTVVLVGEEDVLFAPTVRLAQQKVGRVAARHLLDRGHRRIAAISPPATSPSRASCATRGSPRRSPPPALAVARHDLGFDHDAALALARTWAADPDGRPRALFAYNDEFAALMLRALRDAGLSVPGDIAVLGVDDTPLCELVQPRLSSVALHTSDFAEAHVRVLLELLDRGPARALAGTPGERTAGGGTRLGLTAHPRQRTIPTPTGADTPTLARSATGRVRMVVDWRSTRPPGTGGSSLGSAVSNPPHRCRSACRTKDGPKPLRIRIRTWTCAACGTVLDRDVNAAVNIAQAAGLAVTACRARVRPDYVPAQREEAGTHPKSHRPKAALAGPCALARGGCQDPGT
ncbi:substrate-binding domain-containing protein [Yinghuangia aomiensis]